MISPVYKTYKELMAKHPLVFILYRVGNYYFAFDGFAIVLSQKTDLLTKTRSSDNLIYAAFPVLQLDQYMNTITKRMGMKLAICDRL